MPERVVLVVLRGEGNDAQRVDYFLGIGFVKRVNGGRNEHFGFLALEPDAEFAPGEFGARPDIHRPNGVGFV